MFSPLYLSFLACAAHVALATPTRRALIPTVTLDQGTFIGVNKITTNDWLGIPFAKPPVGELRFQLPQANDPYTGVQSAIAFGPSCPQQSITLPLPAGLVTEAIDDITNSIFQLVELSSEDCLTINVVAPAGVTPGSKLPVVVWIFGGGFELGGTSMYDGDTIVNQSILLGEPVIYVSMNYRLTAFGWLASQEVKDAGVGNLGLQDQRLALRWVQKYISQFGGDPSKVTIWGESAGAISVALQMLTNGGNTEGLFRGAVMESGSPIPVGDITHGQKYYDFLVDQTGCSGSSDTLECLRGVPFQTLMNAVDQTPNIFSFQSLNLAWLPRTDGVFLTAPPQQLVLQGSVADVPFINGDCDDEGTLFSLTLLNITTDQEFQNYVQTNYAPNTTAAQAQELLELYPADPADGSPFNTGELNALSPQFKRLAAFQGDLVFQAPRRFFIQNQASKQPVFSFLSTREKAVPALGSFHSSDLFFNAYAMGDLATYIINFVNHLNPNSGPNITVQWPQYSTASPQLVTFQDNLLQPVIITQDTFRQEAMEFVTNISLATPL